MRLLADLQAEHKMGLILITHDLSVVRHISDRVGVMYLGTRAPVGVPLRRGDASRLAKQA